MEKYGNKTSFVLYGSNYQEEKPDLNVEHFSTDWFI